MPLARKGGLFFAFNLLVVVLLAWLVLPLFAHRSVAPAILSRYSRGYVAYLLAWVALVVAYAATALLGSSLTNRVLAIGTLALFLAGETRVRWLGRGGYPGEDVSRWPRPFVEFIGQPGAQFAGAGGMGGSDDDRAIVLNRLGVRGPVPPLPKRDETRVIVLGASAAFNGNPLANSIPGWIERLARERGRANVRVYNWGVTSYVSGQELALLVTTAIDYQPDMVIAYDGANDASVPFVYDPRPGYPYNWLVYEQGLRDAAPSGPIDVGGRLAAMLLRSRLIATSVFAATLTERAANLPALRAAAAYGSTQWSDAIVDAYFGNLRKMCGLGRAWHFTFVAALQPVLFVKQPIVGSETTMLLEPPLQRHMTSTYERFRTGYRALDAAAATAHEACSYIDVSNALNGQTRPVYWDYVHIDNGGNEIVARRLVSEMIARGLL